MANFVNEKNFNRLAYNKKEYMLFIHGFTRCDTTFYNKDKNQFSKIFKSVNK